MKKTLLPLIAAIIYATAMPAFSVDKAAMEETNPPAASGPLEMSSITIPADTMPPKPQAQPAMPSPQPNLAPNAPPSNQTSAPLPNINTQ